MAESFFDRLGKYYKDVGRVLQGNADIASVFPNSSDVGLEREKIYLEYLKQHLPSSCNIFTGGFLYNKKGEESRQIDIIVTSDHSIKYDFFNQNGEGKSFACIEGTLAVASIKSNLTKSELYEALNNIASIPDKEPLSKRCNPLINLENYENWPYKIIFASNGLKLDTIKKHLNDFYVENSQIPIFKRPDIIHIAGKGAIIKISPNGGETRGGNRIEPNSYFLEKDTTDIIGLALVQNEIQKLAFFSNHIIFTYGSIIDNIPIKKLS